MDGSQDGFDKRAVYERLVAYRKRNGLGCFVQLKKATNGELTDMDLCAMLNAEPYSIAKWKLLDEALDRVERKEKTGCKL